MSENNLRETEVLTNGTCGRCSSELFKITEFVDTTVVWCAKCTLPYLYQSDLDEAGVDEDE